MNSQAPMLPWDRRFDSIIAKFESDWSERKTLEIAQYVPGELSRNARLIRELIRIDREFREKFAMVLPSDQYDQLWPDWHSDAESFELGSRPPKSISSAILGGHALNKSLKTTVSLWEDDSFPIDPAGQSIRFQEGELLAGYRIESFIGEGGMGAVYKALDTKRNIYVALKTVAHLTPQSLYRFKNEFRSLTGVSHPNLVNLFELIGDGGRWFFTMELVDGDDFLTHFRGSENNKPIDAYDLQEALIQLASGIAAIHDSGRLHRDLKPANVVISKAGRVVILDFGLCTLVKVSDQSFQQKIEPAGTVGYMAPEQATSELLSPACDWYSFGIMIYQVLSGHLPFHGVTYRDILYKKINMNPPPIMHEGWVPENLLELCEKLLRPDPAERISRTEIFSLLELKANDGSSIRKVTESISQSPFVGRETEIKKLESIYRSMRANRQASVVEIAGRSGVGKSTFVDRFTELLDGAVVLRGRCFEHESVPFKVFDSVVDSLADFLQSLPIIDPFLPMDINELARVFPTLQRVKEIAKRHTISSSSKDPFEVRKRAFHAFRKLLASLAGSYPIVIIMDDLQWGDIDSIALLTELLAPPSPPPFLLIACYRSEEIASSKFLRDFTDTKVFDNAYLHRSYVSLEALSPVATESLVRELLIPKFGFNQQQLIESIAQESSGNPFFITALVDRVNRDGDVQDRSSAIELTLDSVIGDLIQALPSEAKMLLEVTALHGRPLAQLDAWRATGLSSDERPWLAILTSSRMIRSAGPNTSDIIESFHDRIRENVVANITGEKKKQLHFQIANVLAKNEVTEPEILAGHFFEAGDLKQASPYYVLAAKHASDSLAFDHAANLYKMALDTSEFEGETKLRLLTNLGDALANAGRGADAARIYLDASSFAGVSERNELKRQAAKQFLTSGRIDEGLFELKTVLDSVGLRLAKSQRSAFVSLLYHRAILALKGLRFRQRSEIEISRNTLDKIDIGWAASLGMSMNDNTRAADIQTRHLLLALKAGEPMRITRALAMEVPHMAGHTGIKMKRRAAEISGRAEELANGLNDSYLNALVLATRGVAIYLHEHWADAIHLLERSEYLFRKECRGVAWEMATVKTFQMWATQQMGDLAGLSERSRIIQREAFDRGDLYAVTNLRCFTAFAHLQSDDVKAAHEELDIANSEWSHESYHIQHYSFFQARVAILIYSGDYEAAWKFAIEGARTFQQSFLSRIQLFRIHVLQLTAYSAIALLSTSTSIGTKKNLLIQVKKLQHQVKKEDTKWAKAITAYIQAFLSKVANEKEGMIYQLQQAITLFDQSDMQLFANAIRCELPDNFDSNCQKERETGLEWMAQQHIQSPLRMTILFAPGVLFDSR